ncbi:MAG: hypothetical protein ACP5E3_16490, partial [Bacteroidales bacterium]
DIMLKTLHSEKHRAHEYGMNAVIQRKGGVWAIDWDQGKYYRMERVVDPKTGEVKYYKTDDEDDMDDDVFRTNLGRSKDYKALTHTGSGVSVGRMGPLTPDFMSFATIDTKVVGGDGKEKKVKKTFFERWYEDGENQADETFPWMDLEIKPYGEPPDEMATGAGLWYLSRVRSYLIRSKLFNSIPSSRDMNAEYFRQVEVRMMDKLKKIRPAEVKPGEVPTNPAVHWLAGIILERAYKINLNHPYVKAMIESGRLTRSVERVDKAGVQNEGQATNGPSLVDFIADAAEFTTVNTDMGEMTVYGVGIISNSEAEWLKGLLDVEKVVSYRERMSKSSHGR